MQLEYTQYAYYYIVLNGFNNKLQILLTDRDENIDKDLYYYINIDSDDNPYELRDEPKAENYDKASKDMHQNFRDSGSIMLLNPIN